MLNKILIFTAFLFVFSSTNNVFASTNNHDSINFEKPTFTNNNGENWVLEYIDGRWWWVLYDTDGSIITKVPYDF